MRDEQLVGAALAGDPTAFATLVSRSRARVERLARRMVGEEAEDLVQEAVLRAYLGLPQLSDHSHFTAWLCGITVNLGKMWLRRGKREVRQNQEPCWDGGLDQLEVFHLVHDAVGLLPSGQREAVLMHYIDDLSCDEIATLLQTSPAAVRVRLHRARKQLRQQLGPLTPTQPPKGRPPMIETRIEDVVVRVAENDPSQVVGDQRILLLKDSNRERLLPIWIGSAEGNALALRLTGEATPRPMSSDLMADLVRITGAQIEHVAITSLRDRTFYAEIRITVAGSTHDLDARPSDAVNLAVRVGAPILVEESVLNQHGMPPSDLSAGLEARATMLGSEPPAGTWRSLSAELIRNLYRTP